MNVKQGTIQARAAEFRDDLIMISAKSKVYSCSITVDFTEKGFYSSYPLLILSKWAGMFPIPDKSVA